MWKSNNFLGTWSYDPRDELRARALRAQEAHDTMVAIPLNLAFACANLRECDATTILSHDEDGPLPPIVIRCKKTQGHDYQHHNGYCGWD